MFGEFRRFTTVLMLLVATMVGQPRWLQSECSDDAPERPWQRRLDAVVAAEGEQSQPQATERLRQRCWLPAEPLELVGQWIQVPEVLRGSGAPRAPGCC